MKISTIFFDLGNVLVGFDFNPSIQAIAKKSPYSTEEITQIIAQDQGLIDYEVGKISSQNFFSSFRDKLQYNGSEQELRNLWTHIFTPKEDHITLARQLAPHYPLALLSNTTESHVEYLESQFDFFSLFKERIYSFRVGYAKPQPEIYQAALAQMNAIALESLFIDDIEENILTPSRMGWQTIHLRPDVNLKLALQSYDLEGIL